MYISPIAMEISKEIPHKTKIEHDPAEIVLGMCWKESVSIAHRWPYALAYHIIIRSSQARDSA